jgi:hypothetical protein
MLRELDRRDLLRKGERAADAAVRLEGMTRQILATQVESLRILEQSLEIQRETERHAESLDRKTGPTVAPTPSPAPVAAPPTG